MEIKVNADTPELDLYVTGAAACRCVTCACPRAA